MEVEDTIQEEKTVKCVTAKVHITLYLGNEKNYEAIV